jgi:hypothetical protein
MTVEFLGILVAITGLIVTIVVFIFQSAAQVRLRKADFVYLLNDKYDQICAFRSEHSEVMQFAESWSDKPMATMDAKEKAYFYYAGMTLGFVEIAVYSTFVSKTLTKRDFIDFIRPMIVQEVTFNLPIFRHFCQNGYISQRSKDLLCDVISEIQGRHANARPGMP